MQARAALDLDAVPGVGNFVWEPSLRTRDVLQIMANIPGLTKSLAPARYSTVALRDRAIGTPAWMPKWKSPGVKLRLVIYKHASPCNGLHSLISRAIDVCLDSFSKECWSDISSPLEFVSTVADFNAKGLPTVRIRPRV